MSEHLAVILPTVAGREDSFQRCYGAYRQTVPLATVVPVFGLPTCGEAWNYGAALAERLYGERGVPLRWLHFGADDLVPEPGWDTPALWFADRGQLPAPVLLNDDGSVWNEHERPGNLVGFPRVPLMSLERWRELGPVPAIHYYSDVWLGRRGIPCPVVASYRFRHLWAQAGRIHDSEPDRLAYERALAAEAV